MKPGQIVSLDIRGLGSSGEGVAHLDGYVLFVDGALPGEKVQARVVERRKTHGRAELLSISRRSPDRADPPCSLFGRCGGCQIMHLSYSKQLEAKRQRVVDAMQRIGKIKCEIAPCLPSPSPLAYRNKIQLPAKIEGGKLSFGLYARGSHDLVEVDACPIHCALGEEISKSLRNLLKNETQISLRHLLIKSALATNEALAVLVTDRPHSPALFGLAEKLLASHPALKGIIHNLHAGPENVILGPTFTPLAGADSIQEWIGGLTFQVSAASFFQVNPAQAEHLYEKAIEFAALQGDETVLDAYCGVGTLSLLFASLVKKVIGIESISQAIANAEENRRLNGIENALFICSRAEEWIQNSPPIDIALLNPPRKGCEVRFLEGIAHLAPKKIVYISCDPATLARDLASLAALGYQTEAIQPFDMFPQTAHVESVALLTLRELKKKIADCFPKS